MIALLVTLRPNEVNAGCDEAVEIVVSLPWLQATSESDLGSFRYGEPGPAFTLASIHQEGQVVSVPTFAFGSVLQCPGVPVWSRTLGRDDCSFFAHAHRLSLPDSWPSRPDQAPRRMKRTFLAPAMTHRDAATRASGPLTGRGSSRGA